MYEFFDMLGKFKTSQKTQFHSFYLPTYTDNLKQGDAHYMVGYRPDLGGNIIFLIPCI